jgi:GWxTD domain-containing protein
MNLLEIWVNQPAAAALGWTLVHSIWEGAAVAVVLAAALWVLRSSRARYAASCLALLALLAAFAITFSRMMPEHQIRFAAGTGAAHIPPFDEQSRSTANRIRRTAADYLPWLAPFWIAGMLIVYLRGTISWLAARRLRLTGVCCPPDPWPQGLNRLAARLRLSRPVTLLESSLADVPVVIGHLRPVILMPLGLLTGLPAGQVEAVLLHELAHIRRSDYLVNLLQVFVEGILFYHPAVWWISSVIRSERENCCDDLVVAINGGAYEYATALAALEQNRGAIHEAALAATGGNLVKRIRRLLAQPEGPRAAMTPVVSAATLTVVLVAVMAAWQTKPAPSPAPAAVAAPAPTPTSGDTQPRPKLLAQVKQAPAPQESNPYDLWLKQDVAYIITDAERTAFKSLQTDEEREQFIKQFWLRRDPTPGTPANEFRDEHYRRIAYTNAHFGTKDIAGWKTDRGRIYITYGPPDEIESHPSGGTYQRPASEGGGTTTTFPFEQWRYRYIENIGNNIIVEFVDPTLSGEYRMTMDPSEKDALRLVLPPAGPPNPTASPVGGSVLKAGATVQVMSNSMALISVPLSAYGSHKVSVFARLVTKDNQPLSAFEDTVQGPAPAYTKFLPVRTGSYRFAVVVKDLESGKVASDTIEFEVK